MPTEEQVKQAKPKKSLSMFSRRVNEKDIVVFTRQFSTMIDAGLPLVQALDILSQQSENPALKNIVSQMKIDVESGSTFTDSLKQHPKTFDELYANMVAAGEVGGILDTVLQRLADYIEKAMKLKKRVKSAMTYPAIVIGIAVVCIAVIMIFVVPIFSKLFKDLGGTLPAPTRVVIGISDFVTGWGGLILIAGVFAFIFILKQIRMTTKGRYIIDSIMLKAPIIGVLMRKVAVAKFTRTLGTLLSSGVPILEGLENTARTAGNKVIEKTIFDVKSAVTEGQQLAQPIAESKVFPPMVTSMIAIGESTGALDTMLSKIADFYDDEVDNAVANLTAMLEPMMIVFLGGSVGFTVVAMYLPIFKMMTLIN
ncbi:MAG: type II secretion system F family protein [Candidatus Magnetoovum sp. WYHC-5]|nr:type II secretion system F family protein [Candidatus Magnetoovum sp. WYHC-5]